MMRQRNKLAILKILKKQDKRNKINKLAKLLQHLILEKEELVSQQLVLKLGVHLLLLMMDSGMNGIMVRMMVMAVVECRSFRRCRCFRRKWLRFLC
jgi:hypothetical protein